MIKKVLGIRKLEKNISNVHKMMGQHWGHTNNLYDMHSGINSKIEELENKFDQKTQKILSILNDVLRQLEGDTHSEELEETYEASPVIYNLAKNDDILLRILHERASFSSNSAIPTKELFNNLPFAITMRGLRKKLMSLQKEGLVSTTKISNERRWYIKTGSISKVKSLIRQRNEE